MRRLLTALVVFVAAMAGLGLASAAEKWDMASGYPEGNYFTQNIRQFISDISKAVGSKLEIVLHSNQSLFKLPEMKRAVQSRQVPIAELLLVQFGNEDPLFEVSVRQ